MFLQLFVISIVTGVVEETLFRGFLMARFLQGFKNEFKANLAATGCFVLIHLPIAILVLKYPLVSLLTYVFVIAVVGFGAGFLYGRTKNIIAPAIMHSLWNWTVILFR